MNEGILIIF